jgi:hypothetical protein
MLREGVAVRWVERLLHMRLPPVTRGNVTRSAPMWLLREDFDNRGVSGNGNF